MRRLSVLIAGLLAVQSCMNEELEIFSQEDVAANIVEVRFRTEVSDDTRSSVTVDDSAIKNINVYAFRDGVLADEVYSLSINGVVLNLPASATYNIYAVANMGMRAAPDNEDEFISNLKYSMTGIRALSRGVPMCCVNKNVNVAGESCTVNLHFERLAAKVNLSIDKSSLLEGLRVNSARLCQGASVVYPFRWKGQGGSRVESEAETFDGDYATSADLDRLNAGSEVTFYALENCQGILLPDNDSPELKVPEMIPGKESLCTYLEVDCEFDGSGFLEGDVRYRIYLGLDDCTSFDVPGNSSINISLMLTGDGLNAVSWKVNADVSVRDGYFSGEMVKGMHAMYDLYVGEGFLYEVSFSDELVEYLDNDIAGCTLRLIKDGEEVDGLISEVLDEEGNQLQIEMRCEDVADGELYLYAPSGKVIGCVDEDVRIKLPKMVVSEYPAWMDDEPVESLAYIPECEVNGEGLSVYAYFVDAQGYNLNGARAYGFDVGLFDLRGCDAYSENTPVRCFISQVEVMPKVKGNSAASINVRCVNSGKNHDDNMLLSAIYAAEKTAVMTVTECNFEVSSDFRIGVGILPITLTLVDNGWAGYYSCQLSMKVDNPSNLPLDVHVWQLMGTNSAYSPVDSDYVESNLIIDHVEYMTGEFYNGAPPLYGAFASFYSERNEEGDQALNDGRELVYPLEDISTEDLIKAVNYGHRGSGQMMHMVDATVAGHRLDASDVMLLDKVSDGTSHYDYLYYSSESWDYRGAGLCSADKVLKYPEDWTYDYPNLTPGRLDRLVKRLDDGETVCVSMLYAPNYGKMSVMTFAGMGAQYGLTLGFRYVGCVNGYVRTYPKGTWYAAQDNWCSADFSHEKAGVPLKETGYFVWADDGNLKTAMDQIYGHSYKDSDRPLGADSYMHRAHPTDMDLEMSLRVEGEKGYELYPFYTVWEDDYLEYYHAQDAVTYKCALNPVKDTYTIAVVRCR